MCHAQCPQRSDTDVSRTRAPILCDEGDGLVTTYISLQAILRSIPSNKSTLHVKMSILSHTNDLKIFNTVRPV